MTTCESCNIGEIEFDDWAEGLEDVWRGKCDYCGATQHVEESYSNITNPDIVAYLMREHYWSEDIGGWHKYLFGKRVEASWSSLRSQIFFYCEDKVWQTYFTSVKFLEEIEPELLDILGVKND